MLNKNLNVKGGNTHKVKVIDTVKDYFELALSLMKDDKYIYRGISSDDQKYPKLLRYGNRSEKEYAYLCEFEKYYGLYARTPNFWEFIALAQHHGLMTRLIDFTSNIFVATFFALHRKGKNDNYRLFVLNRNRFQKSDDWNKETRFVSEPDEKMSNILETVFSLASEDGKDYILNPNYSNRRIFVQQGLFIVPGLLTRKHIDTIYNQTEVEIVINARIRKHILERLKNLGYDEYRLMADLDSACTEINTL